MTLHDAAFTIYADALAKTYGSAEVVRDVSLRIAAGRIFGLVGPNGAGKTTITSILTGLLTPTRGEVHLLGRPMSPNARDVKRRIGFVLTDPQLFDALTADEMLHAVARIYGVGGATAGARIDELIEFFGLGEARHRPIADYSHGMRKKTALAAALLHDPEILFLDEPFEGMDPAAVDATANVLGALARRGRTIFVTSHMLPLVERLCDEIAILHRGEIVLQAGPADLRAAARPGRGALESVFLEITGQPVNRGLSWVAEGGMR